MRSQLATTDNRVFDSMYRRVPSDKVTRLKEFRSTHPLQHRTIGDTDWEYISCGRGEQALLLLPGALSRHNAIFILKSRDQAGKLTHPPLWITGKLFPWLPRSVFVPLLKLRLNKLLLSTLRAAGHPEYEFWRAYLNEAIASGRLKEVFRHQNKCLLDCVQQQPQFTPDDLKEWPGRILIIESDNDVVGKADRELLRKTYPQAQIHTFHNLGHASSILKRAEVVSIIKKFLHKTES